MITRDSDGHATSLVMQSFATEQDALHAVAVLRAAGFSAAAIGLEARNADTMAHVARATGVVPITVVSRGAVVGRVLGAAVGFLLALLVAVLPGLAPGPANAAVVVLTLLGTLAGHVAGTIIGARGAVGTPAHEARRYRQRYAAGDIVVVVDAGERRQDAQRILMHGSVGL
jgi:hypothetical protein